MNDQQIPTKPTPYHIYGRQSYAQPLTYIRTASASTPDSLPAPEGDDWIEVVAFPASAVIRVIPHQGKEVNWTHATEHG